MKIEPTKFRYYLCRVANIECDDEYDELIWADITIVAKSDSDFRNIKEANLYPLRIAIKELKDASPKEMYYLLLESLAELLF